MPSRSQSLASTSCCSSRSWLCKPSGQAEIPALFEPAREQPPHGASSQCLDEPAAADAFSSHMIGFGKQPDSTQLRVLQDAHQQACNLPPEPDSFLHAWQAAETGVEFEVYQRATLRGTEIVHAKAYQRSGKTSYFCLVFYELAQPGSLPMSMPHAAHIKWFVKVTLPRQQLNTEPRTERSAIADTLPLQQREFYGGSYFAHSLSTPQLVPEPNGQMVSTTQFPLGSLSVNLCGAHTTTSASAMFLNLSTGFLYSIITSSPM